MPRLSLWQRLRYAMVRPDDDAEDTSSQEDRSVEEIQETIARADDKERAIGLIAAPIAAVLSFLIIGTLIHDDPPIDTKNYVNPSLYHTLELVLLGLAVGILVTALLRKRMILGIAFALYGLAVFNLHYWGFGVPFLLAGAWYLVRAYRLNQELKRAGGADVSSLGVRAVRPRAERVPAAPQQAVHATDVSLPRRTVAGRRDPPSTESGRVGTLRGASVSFNPRRLVQGVLGLVMVTLAITAIVLAVAGLHSNDQINRLHTQGQPVTVTVGGCLGLLGGSGSNDAGYSCRGTYQLDGHVYHEPLPGTTFYRPGTSVPSIAVPGDPAARLAGGRRQLATGFERRVHRPDCADGHPSCADRCAALEGPSEAPGLSTGQVSAAV